MGGSSQIAGQRELMQQKLETIGFMTSGVAHDFKNILAAMGSAVRLLRRAGPKEDLLRGLEEAQERGVSLTNELLRFAKDQEIKRTSFVLDDQLQLLHSLIRRSTGPAINLNLSLHASCTQVEASPAFFDAAIMNLVVNATQAMPGGGELTIASDTTIVSGHPRLASGRYAAIRVIDSGHGIAPEMMSRLFQPFATTKGAQGTGLGLHQTRKFVREAGGDIEVSSKVDEGTEFRILLPAYG